MKRLSQWIGIAIVFAAIAATVALGQISAWGKASTHTIAFAQGTELANGMNARIQVIAARLADDESLEAVITGHTGTIGDPDANHALSVNRARMVQARIVEAMRAEGDDAIDRIRTFGAGGTQPLEQNDDEADRAYQRRLARATVEISVALP